MSRRTKLISGAAAVILLLLIGYAGGRYVQPAKIEIQERTKIQTQVVEKVVTVTQVQTVKVADKQNNVVVERVWVTAPDGTTTTKETTKDLTKETVKTDARAASTTDAARSLLSIEERNKTTTITNRATWGVSLQPGLDFRALASEGVAGLSLKNTMLGATVERRVIGPLWLGAWGNTRGAGGVSIRLEY